MKQSKKLDSATIDRINLAIFEIKQYTDQRTENKEEWKHLAFNSLYILMNLPSLTSLGLSETDIVAWEKICQPFSWTLRAELQSDWLDETSFSWESISPLIEELTELLTRYGYKSEKKQIKAPSSKVNHAVAKLYLYTLWYKHPNQVKTLLSETKTTVNADSLKELAVDALWYLSSFGNDANHAKLISLEEEVNNETLHWTKVILALEKCKIEYTDPVVWIKQNQPYHLLKTIKAA